MKVILASKSPRRRELMDLTGIKYEVIVSDADETLEDGLTIEEQAKRISYIKAKTVFDKTQGDRIVIGSDTMVIKEGKIYGKPHSDEEAFQMLKDLNNSKHQVITGLAILVERNGEVKNYLDYDLTDVYFTQMSDEEILGLIHTGKAYDKAGAYAVQGEFMVYIDRIDGNFASVMGLPVHKVNRILKEELKK